MPQPYKQEIIDRYLIEGSRNISEILIVDCGNYFEAVRVIREMYLSIPGTHRKDLVETHKALDTWKKRKGIRLF